MRVQITRDEIEKKKHLVNDFFSQDIRDTTERVKVAEACGGNLTKRHTFISVHEFYRELTGDKDLTFNIAEAMDTTISTAILIEGMQTRMLYSYNHAGAYKDWERIVRISPKKNFKKNEAIGAAGFTGYATKTKSSAFATITETGATKEEYSLLIRGGMFNLSYEDILNDDIDYVAGLPGRLGLYAARQVSAYMWNLVTSNPTLAADSISVFDNATHANYLTDALADASLSTAIGLLQAQTHPNSTDKLLTIPRYLATSVNNSQRKTAYELTTRAYGANNTVASFAQAMDIIPIVNPHTTDTTDWYLFGDPNETPVIEAGFLFGNTEPEITPAMSAGVGDWFSKLDAQFQVQHCYNATWVSYKGAVGAIVAD